MNLTQCRLGVLFAPTAPLWTGTVSSWNADTFVLSTATVTGTLSTDMVGLAVAWDGRYLRIKSLNVGTGVLTLAETEAAFAVSDALTIYNARFPFPRYQYLDANGVVFKDYDIAWSSSPAALPPLAWAWANPLGSGEHTEAIWIQTGVDIEVNAGDSRAMSSEASGGALTYAWSSDAAATFGTPTASLTTVRWSTDGFRYLKLVVTDNQSVATTRYLPVWVGSDELHTDVQSCSMGWDAQRGWETSLQFNRSISFLRCGQIALVDLDTGSVVAAGWHYPGTWQDDFEYHAADITLKDAFGWGGHIHAYPLVIEDTAAPSTWAEIKDLTLPRALWFLLYWHSTLSEVANVGTLLLPTARAIAGQEFTAGTVAQQVLTMAQAAFHRVVGARSMGFSIEEDPLFLTEADFNSLLWTYIISTDATVKHVGRERAVPQVSEALLSGVYASGGDWTPIIIRGPTHPLQYGSPQEMTGLAPISLDEIKRWASRYLAIQNNADRYTAHPLVDITPADHPAVVLPNADTTRIALESVQLQFDPETGSWSCEIGGHEFGNDVTTVVEPPPPPIVPPPPPPPPPAPPGPPPIPPPTPQWPVGGYIATRSKGIFYTENFSGPGGVTPVWTAVNSGLPSLAVSQFAVAPSDPQRYQFCIANAIAYRRVDGGSWTQVLTSSAGVSWITGDADNPGYLYAMTDHTSGYYTVIQKSTDYGDTWAAVSGNIGSLYGNGNLTVRGGKIYFSVNTGAGTRAYFVYSLDDGATWASPAGPQFLGWVPQIIQHPYGWNDNLIFMGELPTYTFNLIKRSGALMAETALAASYAGFAWAHSGNTGFPRMSFAVDALIMRNIAGDTHKIFKTLDGWATKVAGGDFVCQTINARPEYPDNLLLGRATGLLVGDPHCIFVSADDGVTTEGKAGADPENPASVVSIPYDCGGVSLDGVQLFLYNLPPGPT